MAKVLVICSAVAVVLLNGVWMAEEVQNPQRKGKYALTLYAVKNNDGVWNTDYTLKKWNAANEWTVIVRQNASEVEVNEVPAKANITILRTTYNISDEISIPCLVEGYPIPSIVWYKDGNQIETGERVELKDPHQLIIHRANTSDSGNYRCEATNPFGNSSSFIEILVEGIEVYPKCEDSKFFANCDLIVRARYCSNKHYAKFCCRSCALDGQIHGPNASIPAKANITLLKTKYHISDEISIPCRAEGFPIPSIVWNKDGNQIETGERVELKDPHQLIIHRANTSDSGNYRCEATNPFGNSSSFIQILVEGTYLQHNCTDNEFFAVCDSVVKGRYCWHKYYATFCCRSCTLHGQLASHGPHLDAYRK